MLELPRALAAAGLLAAAAAGQDLLLEHPGEEAPDSEGWASFARAGATTYQSADLEGRPGSLELGRYELGLELQRHSAAGLLDLRLDHSRQNYGEGWQLGGLTRPLEMADHYRLQAAWFDQGAGDLSWYLGARAEAGSDSREDPFDDAVLGASLGLELDLTEGLGLELSLDALQLLEDGERLVSLALVDWRLAEDLRLGRVAGGYGIDWDYDLETRYFLALDQDERQFRLDEVDGGGVVRDRERTLRAGMLWQPRADLRLELSLGQAERRLTLLEDDSRIDAFEVEDAPFLGVRLDFGPGALF